MKSITFSAPALNIGSGGRALVPACAQVQVDVALTPLKNVAGAVVADAQALPFVSRSFAAALCVGSVLNYCDAARLIFEAGRVLRKGATLVLEFERSNSIEYAGTEHFGRAASLASVRLRGEEHMVWLYADSYVQGLLKQAGFVVTRRRYFHVFTAVVHRLLGDQERAARWSALDRIFSHVPLVRGLSGNVIFACERI